MPSTPGTGTRRERHDTKTLVRLDTTRESGPVPKPPATATSEQLEGGRCPNVHLWFQGVGEPVRACAELSETGLSLDAPLPFLERDSVVGCVTLAGGGLAHGRIRHVELDTSSAQVPRLKVAVELDQRLDAGDAHETYAIGDVIPDEEHAAADEPPSSSNLDTLPPARDTAATGLLPVLTAVLVGLAAGAGAAYAWLGTRVQPPPPAPALPPPAPIVRTEVGPRVEPPSIVVALAAGSHDELARARAAQWLLQPEPLAPFTVAPPQLPVDDEASALDEVEPVPPPEVALEDEAAAAAARSGRGFLQVQSEGAYTRVFVPMSGSADGMRRYELTTPGVVVTLPHAAALAPLENYAVSQGLVRRVWLRRTREGVQVRVITRRAASRIDTSFDQYGLTVVLGL